MKSQGSLHVEKLVISGVFSLDGQDFDVDNNVWLIGNDEEVMIVDAPHDPVPIANAIDGRTVVMVVCTHGHNDHVNAAVTLSEAVDAPVALHPDDRMLWDAVHPGREPDVALQDGQTISVGGQDLTVIHTPGHSPGGICLHLPSQGWLFSGDTLFQGGPGATGRSYSDFPTILDSIRERLFPLPDDTKVLTGHGDDTTIGAERPAYDEWVARGH